MKVTDDPPPGNGGKKAWYTDPGRKPAALPVNPDGIPAELRAADRWVLWALTWKANKDGGGKWDKVPKTPAGRNASSTNPKTWVTFAAAMSAYRTGGFDGVGFVLGDGHAGIDLDGVRDRSTGTVNAGWAPELVARAGTAADVSPSGTGVKLFGRGKWSGGWHKRPHPSGAGEIEVYDAGRFFTVTGHAAGGGGTTVADIQPTLDALAHLFDPKPPPNTAGGYSPSDDELLEHVRRSKQGDKFARLMAGDTSEHGGDDSSADLALCAILAFWAGPDPDRIDRLFRRSGLFRSKWDARRGQSTYGRQTIDKALAGKTEFFTGGEPAARPAAEPRADTTPPPRAWPDPPAGEAFHGLAGRVVRTLEPASEADPVALLVQTLILFGNAVGRGPHFAVEGDRHFTNEFAALVGPTAAGRKGTSFGRVRSVFADLDLDWLERRVVSGTSSGEGLLWAVRDPIRKRERVARGRGSTPEYEEVEADPGEPDKRAVVYEPEFAGVLKQTERQGNTASVVLRQLWDGREVVQTLTKNNPARATSAHVSMIGHITPEELHRYLTATETANGFANRYLFVCVRRARHLPDGGALDPAALPGLQRALGSAVAFARTVGEVARHPSARRLWHGVYPLLTRDRVRLGGALAARAAPHALRLALLYALLDHSPDIRPVHLLAGVALWDYCERSVEFLFADRTGNPVADEVRDLLRGAPAGLTRTELVAALGRHQYGDKLTQALVTLEVAGLARRESERTAGRSAERWFATAKAATTSPLMATARELSAGRPDRDRSDECDGSPPPPAFGRNGRFGRTSEPDPPGPVWDDPGQFLDLLRARGWGWSQALAWLSAPPTAGFFDLPGDRRQRLVEHLERLTTAKAGAK